MDRAARTPLPLACLVLLSAIILLLAAQAAGCGNGDSASDTTVAASLTNTTGGPVTSLTGSDGDTPTTDAGPPTTARDLSGNRVTFPTEDGFTLSGHLYGSGQQGVVLSHMYPADQTSWTEVAQALAQEGYLVLTYDFRGYGHSEGSKDIKNVYKDVSAAVGCIRGLGASDVVLIGASMGGTASLMAAVPFQAMSSFRLAGVVTLSAPVQFEGLSASDAVPLLVVPLLFIAAENDGAAGQAQQLENLSAGKGDLQIVPGGDHGTDLFLGAQADSVMTMLVDFLQQSLQVGNL